MQGEHYADEDWYEMKGWPKEVTDAYDQKFDLYTYNRKSMTTSMDTEGDPKKPPLDADLMLYSLFEVTKSEGEGDRQSKPLHDELWKEEIGKGEGNMRGERG